MSVDNKQQPKSPLFFELDEKTLKAVGKIVGPNIVPCVEDAVWAYSFKKRFYDKQLSIPEMNQKLKEARKHISWIKEIFSDPTLRDYLFRIELETNNADRLGIFNFDPRTFINITPELRIIKALEIIDELCQAVIEKQTSDKGRPKGQKAQAIYSLLNSLCGCCEMANSGALTTKPENLLEKLVKVLNGPLMLGGDQPRRVINVIKKREEERKRLTI